MKITKKLIEQVEDFNKKYNNKIHEMKNLIEPFKDVLNKKTIQSFKLYTDCKNKKYRPDFTNFVINLDCENEFRIVCVSHLKVFFENYKKELIELFKENKIDYKSFPEGNGVFYVEDENHMPIWLN